MLISLTRGLSAQIDDEDFPMISKFHWTIVGDRNLYAVTAVFEKGKRRNIRMHRLILGAPDGMQVDHIDGNGLNNLRSNLRLCTHSQNMWNSKNRRHNTSGYRNVMKTTVHGKSVWEVVIKKENRPYKKRFRIEDLHLAVKWANETRVLLHGEFAYQQDIN